MTINDLSGSKLRGDVFGGITAAIVALPLAIAFGVSSGLGAIAGIYGAIFTGFFASLFGGTPTQITGPTGPMTIIMATIVATYMQSNPEQGIALAFTVVIMAGFVQILFGISKLGKYIILVPYPVISGFMSGIGVIIIGLQIGPLFGYASSANVLQTIQQLPEFLAQPHWPAIVFGLGTLALLIYWPTRLSMKLPSTVVALVLGTLLSIWFLSADDLARVGSIPAGFPSIKWPTYDTTLLRDMMYSAILLAGLGSIDSLLTSMVADTMAEKHHDTDRELVGQGIGNMISGLFGALPGAGATVRTVINIRSGGKTKLSGIIHSLCLLIIILGAGFLAEDIPHAVLAGILIKVGIDIIDWRFIKRMYRLPFFTVFLTLTVLFLTVFVDLIAAVMIGAFIANMVTIDRLSHVQLDGIHFTSGDEVSESVSGIIKQLMQQAGNKALLFELQGPISFGVARRIGRQLSEFKQHRILIIDLSKAVMVGITTSMIIEDAIIREQDSGRIVYLSGINQQIENNFKRLDVYNLIKQEHRFHDLETALSCAIRELTIEDNSI